MKQTIAFFTLVQDLQTILGNTNDVMSLIDLINKQQFLDLRSKIVNAFDIGEVAPFEGDFGENVELGDVSDAVIGVTLEMYPKETPLDLPLDITARKEWCHKILEALDGAAVYYF